MPTAADILSFNHITLCIWQEPSQPSTQKIVAADTSSGGKDTVNQAPDNVAKSSGVIQISEEQRARMDANKLKALQRAAARTTHNKST